MPIKVFRLVTILRWGNPIKQLEVTVEMAVVADASFGHDFFDSQKFGGEQLVGSLQSKEFDEMRQGQSGFFTE